ncbi:hypothetical protein LTR67_008852 [Exophiala xenobiotica]
MDNDHTTLAAVETMPSTHVEFKTEENAYDTSFHLDTAFKRESPLSFMADCPSLSSSFLSSGSSIAGSHYLRRSSLGSCSSLTSPDMFFTPPARFTSPITPMMQDPGLRMTYQKCLKPAPCLDNCHPIFHVQEEDQYPQECVWMSGVGSSPGLPMTDMSNMLMSAHGHPLYDSRQSGISNVISNPALTKSIFDGPLDSPTMHGSDHDLLRWTLAHTPAETIEPSVTFQRMLPSSPSYKLEPSTPLKARVPPSAILSSSPLSMISPSVLPSQHDVDELSYDDLEQVLRRCDSKRHRTHHDRLHRRGYERRNATGISKSTSKPAASSSGINCAPIIEENPYPCTYPGCIDKGTGKPKRFKRQEHRKRHEKTVHESGDHEVYRCWVPECNRAFSRTDNLKSHLRNTHSKKPGVRGNRYVATLDKNSQYYDPDWVGDLDKNGFPMV